MVGIKVTLRRRGKRMSQLTIKIDEHDKEEIEKICKQYGIDLSTLYCLFAKKVVDEQKIPFEIEL